MGIIRWSRFTDPTGLTGCPSRTMLADNRGDAFPMTSLSMTDATDRDEQPIPGHGVPVALAEPPTELPDGLPASQRMLVQPGSVRSLMGRGQRLPLPPSNASVIETVVDVRRVALNAVPVVALSAPFVASGQPGLGLAIAFCTSVALVLRRISQRVPFGLGDGFVAFRETPGWPRGVQEEYDVTWGVGAARQQPAGYRA